MSGINKIRRFHAGDAEEVSALIKLIIRTLEQDEFFLRVKPIEIPASITAVGFYRNMGHEYKFTLSSL